MRRGPRVTPLAPQLSQGIQTRKHRATTPPLPPLLHNAGIMQTSRRPSSALPPGPACQSHRVRPLLRGLPRNTPERAAPPPRPVEARWDTMTVYSRDVAVGSRWLVRPALLRSASLQLSIFWTDTFVSTKRTFSKTCENKGVHIPLISFCQCSPSKFCVT